MNDLWLCILVGHLNKNGACSVAKQSNNNMNHRSIFNSIVTLCECIYPKANRTCSDKQVAMQIRVYNTK